MRGQGVVIVTRKRVGLWYTYTCAVQGETVSLDIPVNQIETRSEAEADALVKRNAEALTKAQQEGLLRK